MKKLGTLSLAVVLLSSFLIGCGGGNGSGSSANISIENISGETISTGVLSDAGAVSGIEYRTASQSGSTDSNGTFSYVSGETITFSIGNIVVGQAVAAPNLSTFNLVGISPPLSGFGIPNKTPQSLSFQQAINISVFLQTLDEDANPTNGISIPKETIPLASNVTIKFNQNFSTFETSFALRQFIARCRAAGLWGGSRPIVKSGYAINRLYSNLGLSPMLYAVGQTNSVNNGTPLEGYIFSYDVNGNQIKTKSYDGNNLLQSTGKFYYDAKGNKLQERYYDSNDVLQGSYRYSYDANGNRIQSSYRDANNVLQQKTDYFYDVNGNLIQDKYYASNNTLDASYEHSYDVNGNRIQSKYYDSNNILRSMDIYSYDANGNRIQSKYYDSNNVPQSSYGFLYDASDNLTRVRYYDSNNVPQSTYTYSYDANGNRIQDKAYNSSNVLLSSVDFTYSADGYLVQTKAYNSNNLLQWMSTETYYVDGFILSSKYETTSGFLSISTNTKSAISGWIQILGGYFGGPS